MVIQLTFIEKIVDQSIVHEIMEKSWNTISEIIIINYCDPKKSAQNNANDYFSKSMNSLHLPVPLYQIKKSILDFNTIITINWTQKEEKLNLFVTIGHCISNRSMCIVHAKLGNVLLKISERPSHALTLLFCMSLFVNKQYYDLGMIECMQRRTANTLMTMAMAISIYLWLEAQSLLVVFLWFCVFDGNYRSTVALCYTYTTSNSNDFNGSYTNGISVAILNWIVGNFATIPWTCEFQTTKWRALANRRNSLDDALHSGGVSFIRKQRMMYM